MVSTDAKSCTLSPSSQDVVKHQAMVCDGLPLPLCSIDSAIHMHIKSSSSRTVCKQFSLGGAHLCCAKMLWRNLCPHLTGQNNYDTYEQLIFKSHLLKLIILIIKWLGDFSPSPNYPKRLYGILREVVKVACPVTSFGNAIS